MAGAFPALHTLINRKATVQKWKTGSVYLRFLLKANAWWYHFSMPHSKNHLRHQWPLWRLRSVLRDLGPQEPNPRDMYLGHCPGLCHSISSQGDEPLFGPWGEQQGCPLSRTICLNQATLSLHERTCTPWMETFTMGPTLLHTIWRWGSSYSAARPLSQKHPKSQFSHTICSKQTLL